MDIRKITAIDIHSHFNHGSQYDADNESEIYKCDLPFLMNKYDHTNIGLTCCSTFAAVMSTKDIPAENEYLYNLSLNTPRLFQWVVIDPRVKETFIQADKMLDSPKCLGIKLDSPSHGYDIEEYADEIFSFAAQRNATVKMCFAKMDKMPGFVNKYPSMRLIIAHLGSVAHVDAISNAIHGNIYTDTSGGASSNNNVVEYAVSRVGSDHILFGTDTYDAGFQRGRIEYALISEQDKLNILKDNALRMFPKLKKQYTDLKMNIIK